jgi:hypothetical protein
VTERNFATIDVTGGRQDRRLTVSVFDVNGSMKWSRAIAASELREPGD